MARPQGTWIIICICKETRIHPPTHPLTLLPTRTFRRMKATYLATADLPSADDPRLQLRRRGAAVASKHCGIEAQLLSVNGSLSRLRKFAAFRKRPRHQSENSHQDSERMRVHLKPSPLSRKSGIPSASFEFLKKAAMFVWSDFVACSARYHSHLL